jgi:hypothetical protein
MNNQEKQNGSFTASYLGRKEAKSQFDAIVKITMMP